MSREPLPNFSADLLEFDSLRQLVGRFVRGPLGQAEIEKLEPHSDRAALEESLADVAEAMAYFEASEQRRPPRAVPRFGCASIPSPTSRRR